MGGYPAIQLVAHPGGACTVFAGRHALYQPKPLFIFSLLSLVLKTYKKRITTTHYKKALQNEAT